MVISEVKTRPGTIRESWKVQYQRGEVGEGRGGEGDGCVGLSHKTRLSTVSELIRGNIIGKLLYCLRERVGVEASPYLPRWDVQKNQNFQKVLCPCGR